MRAVLFSSLLMAGAAIGAETKIVTNSVGMDLIELPAGKFMMGRLPEDRLMDNSNEPFEGVAVHIENLAFDRVEANTVPVEVTLTKPFLLGKTEVTQGQWKQVMGSEPWESEEFTQCDEDCAATCVSFFEATEFCDVLTDLERRIGKLADDQEYRLPTEAEWEYACRAGTTTPFSFGDESKINSYAYWGGDAQDGDGKITFGPGNAGREQYAHKVGLKKPNLWGFHDMHGNAEEWCSDWFVRSLNGGADPVGPEGGYSRVCRGGAWYRASGQCRSSTRVAIGATLRGPGLGFRVARSQTVR